MNKLQLNFKVRMKNRLFWITLIPAIIVFIQTVCGIFGIELNLSEKQEQLTALVDAVFGVLVILGVVTDPTTKGVSDSDKAMGYEEPKED